MASLPRVISGRNRTEYEACLLPRLDSNQADSIRLIASRQIEKAQQDAYSEGIMLGRRDAYNRFSGQLQSIVSSISDTLTEFDDKTLKQLAMLVITCSRQLIRHELSVNPDLMVTVVRDAVKLLPLADREINILMHPEDCAVVRDAFEDEGSAMSINILQDPVLSRGSCVVMSEESRIDASLESRLEALIEHVFGQGFIIDEPTDA